MPCEHHRPTTATEQAACTLMPAALRPKDMTAVGLSSSVPGARQTLTSVERMNEWQVAVSVCGGNKCARSGGGTVWKRMNRGGVSGVPRPHRDELMHCRMHGSRTAFCCWNIGKLPRDKGEDVPSEGNIGELVKGSKNPIERSSQLVLPKLWGYSVSKPPCG
ncbi:hypothetical protein MJT46_015926 [Ovis ammon polii x Ovis aries]|nr:hypothetical protein MJT46_015926 [Ovis ammon polii x Ovis aries]